MLTIFMDFDQKHLQNKCHGLRTYNMGSDNLNDSIKQHTRCQVFIQEIGRKLIMINDRYGIESKK